MPTASIRWDHGLIEKVTQSIKSIIQLLNDRKQIPQSILYPIIDYSKNFTEVYHHTKEENVLFSALEQAGILQNIVSITMMLMDHERLREITKHSKILQKNTLIQEILQFN